MNGQQGWMQTLLPLGIVVVVLLLRIRRMNTMRRLRLDTLWILPAIYTAVAGVMYVWLPPQGLGWIACVVALAIGLALGWQRGRLMQIAVDPETHQLNHRASPAAMLFIVGLIGIRTALREAMAHGGAMMLHLNAATVVDALLALGWGVIVAQRVEMYLRARRLLDRARRG